MKRAVFFTVVSAVVLALTFGACKHEVINPPATYTVTVATGITHGTVSADKETAQKDEDVTITIAPTDDYELDSISVKDADNNDIAKTTVTAGTRYTFVMPESNVTINVTFKQKYYRVIIDGGITNGCIVTAAVDETKGSGVDFGVFPNGGYELDSISVKDANNNDIAITKLYAGCYTFVMPGSNVTVSATFVQEMLAMVDVITSATTITGQDPSFVDSGESNFYKGAFRTGRNVTLSPYRMSKYEVSQGVYAQYMAGESLGGKNLASEPSYCMETGTFPLVSGEVQSKRPVEGVTWYDAVYFCNALTEKTLGADKKVYTITNSTVDSNGHITSATVTQDMTKTGYRLPTEAEWEFAARGGDQTKPDWNYLFSGHATADGVSYSNSKNSGMDTVGWYKYNIKTGTTGNEIPSSGTQGNGTHEVGKKSPNRLGIYDMSGNVWEWCYDGYSSVEAGDVTNPASSGSSRVGRGGSWGYFANDCSVTYRRGSNPDDRSNLLGFRLVRSAN